MAYNFGSIDPSSQPNNDSFILRFTYNDLHNTFLIFNLDASTLSFVKNVGKGSIITTHATDFEALSGYGTVTVVVANIGDITASFSVAVVNCNAGVEQIPAKTITLDPGSTGQLSFTTQAYYETGNKYNCEGACVRVCEWGGGSCYLNSTVQLSTSNNTQTTTCLFQ